MPTWVLYLFGAVFIATVVAGGYLWLDRTLAAKDARILAQQGEIAGLVIENSNLTSAYEAAQKTIKNQKRDLVESQAQATRIKQADAAERQRQADFDRKIQGITVQDPTNLDKINAYQTCVSRNVNDPECGKLLQ
jgi:hypothetical protein